MYSTIKTAILEGIQTQLVTVEVDIAEGMPMFDMVGNLSSEVREAKERVRTALHNCGILLPPKRITLNLSPGNVRKSGTGFDLPIAVALLVSLGLVEEAACQACLFVGELSLNGKLLPVPGILPIVSDGIHRNIENFIMPRDNLMEGELVPEAKCYGFSDLQELISFLNSGNYEKPSINIEEIASPKRELDFCQVNGQTFLKRACEVAASGMHNMLIVGPPGAGKTMVSERMPSILPPLSEEEKLELSKIYSVCGMLGNRPELISERPFRNPHHTVTRAALTGGGNIPKPGEISLAHQGVLFLDELTEFQKATLEVLRQPLEEGKINLSRLNSQVSYPSNFLLLAAMNPCSCGYFPDMQKCRCTPATRKRYYEKVSQPLIDRIDICVEAPTLTYMELTQQNKSETSEEIRKRVINCQQIQFKRYQNEDFLHNSQIPASKMKQYCFLGDSQRDYMEEIYGMMSLTGRTYHKILRVARTLADMEECSQIGLHHLKEAVCYRSIQDKYWGGVS